LLVDTNVLGKICHPRKYQDVRAWFRLAATRHELLLSDMAQARAEDATVVTSNTRHFESLVPAMDWPQVPVS
jgi:predicted nucleic acid-binding protein